MLQRRDTCKDLPNILRIPNIMWMVKRREKTEFRKILERVEVMEANKWFCKTLHKMFSIQGIKKIN